MTRLRLWFATLPAVVRWTVAAAGTPLIVLVAFGVVCGLWMGGQQLIGNFHTVIPGELYRSAQFNPEKVEYFERQYGIKTIINLLGPSDLGWYKQEVEASAKAGIAHIDFKLSASRELTRDQITALIAIMRAAPKPILVHCKGGSDRSGLASALYLAAIAGASEQTAERQLSAYYGHISLPFAPAWAMDVTWEDVERMLGFGAS